MRVIQAKSAGFCYGVRRAVELAEKAVEAGPVVMLGPIIHNDHVIAALRDKGAVCVESVEEVPEGATVVGVPGRIVRLCGDKLDHIHTPDPVMLEIEELKRRMALLEEQINDTKKET